MPSINDPIVQLKAIELKPPIPTFLWDMLVEDRGAVAEGEVIWDYRKGSIDGMAPFVAEDVGGVPMERTGFETRQISFPTLAPERIIEKNQIMQRSFGEVVYGGKSPEQRSREMIAEDLNFLREKIQMRLEWMAAELLTTGKLTLPTFTEHGVLVDNKVADFGFTNTSTVVNKWDANAADIFGDIDDMYEQVVDGLGQITTLIMAPDVGAAMMNNESFLKKHDLLRATFGALAPKYASMPGVRYLGTTNDGIEMYTYSRQYMDDKGEVKPYIPAKTIYGVAPKIFTAYFGPVTMIERDGENFRTYMARMVPYRYSYAKSNTIVQRLTSRPIIMPKNVDAWCSRTVL